MPEKESTKKEKGTKGTVVLGAILNIIPRRTTTVGVQAIGSKKIDKKKKKKEKVGGISSQIKRTKIEQTQ